MNKGFTFLEAIIAILVLTMAIVIVLQIFPLALNIERSSQKRTQGIELAQGKIEILNSKSYPDILIGTFNEPQLDSPFESFSRETKITHVDSNLQQSPSNTGLKKIEIIVCWGSGKNVKLISLIAER